MNTTALQQPQIERGVITVANIYPAKAPGQSAWIKDTSGVMFGYRPEKIGVMNVGEAYDIDFTANVKNGTTYRDIRSARAATPPGPPPAQFTAGQAPRTASPNSNKSGEYYRPTSPKDARRMFLCSTLNAFIQTGRIDAHRDHLTAVIKEILAAYDATVALDD
jgi:hypothetical protein